MAEPGVKWANDKTEGPAGPGLEEVKTLQQPTGATGTMEDVPAGPIETPPLKSGSVPAVILSNKSKSEEKLAKAHKNAENLAKEVGSIQQSPGEIRTRAALTKKQKNSNNLFGKNSQKYHTSNKPPPINNLADTQKLTPVKSNLPPVINKELNSTSQLVPVVNPAEVKMLVLPLKEGLPTLLRFGPYDSSSEYIELDGKKFKSTSFDMFGLGIGRSEMNTLYGITDVDEIAVLQKVFGVSSLGKTPLFVEYYTKKCSFTGKDVVIKALQNRVNTISEQMEKESNASNTGKRLKHQYEWIYTTVSELATFTAPCEEPVTKTSINVSTETNISLLQKTNGCPCLTEINLLRDLVVLIALLQGNASEEIKKKMHNIPLNRLLNAVKSNKPTNVPVIMKEVLTKLLEHLQEIQSSPVTPTTTNSPNPELLLQVYRILRPENTNRNSITLPEITKILHTMMIDLNRCGAAKEDLTEIQRELAEVRAELETLQGQKQNNFVIPGVNTADLERQLRDAEEALRDTEELRLAAEVKLAEMTRDKELQGANLQTVKAKLEGEIAAAKKEEGTHRQLIVDLNGDIDIMSSRLDDLLGLIVERQSELTIAQKELEAITEALSEEKRQHVTTKNERDALQVEYDGLVTTIDDLNKKGASNKNAASALSAELEKQKAQLETLREQLDAKTKEEERLRQEIATAESTREGLSNKIKSLERQLELRNARIAELEQEQDVTKGSEVKIATLEAKVTELTQQLERKLREYAEASSALQNELSGLKSNEAACTKELDSLKLRLQELQEKAGRVNAAERTVVTIREELETAKSSLRECNEESSRKQSGADRELDALRLQLKDTQESLRRLEEQSQSQKSENAAEKTHLADQLAQVKSRVEAQESEIAALQSKGGQVNTEYTNAKEVYESRIATLEEELAALQKSSVEAKNTAIGEEQKKCEGRVTELQGQLTYLETQVHTAKGEVEKAKTDAQSSAAQSSTAKAEYERRIDELNVSIESLKGELASANASLAAAQAAKVASDGELGSLQASLAAAQSNSKNKNLTIGHQKAEIERLTGALASTQSLVSAAPKQSDLDEATQTIKELQGKLGGLDMLEKEKTELDATKQRLTNILTAIAISPEQKDAVTKILQGDEADLAPFYKTLDKEACDFFHYLYDTINIQLRALEELPVFKANEELKANIFSMYAIAEENKPVLLEELTRLFQEFFTKFNAKTGIPGQGIDTQENYPELQKLFGIKVEYSIGIPLQTKLRDDLKQISSTLKQGGFHISEQKIITMKQSFPSELNGIVPLSVLAIKLIQLLHKTFEGKFKELKERCSVLPKEDGTENTEGLTEEPSIGNITKTLGQIQNLIKDDDDSSIDLLQLSREITALKPGSDTYASDSTAIMNKLQRIKLDLEK